MRTPPGLGQEASGHTIRFPSQHSQGGVPRQELLPQAEVRVCPCECGVQRGAVNRLLFSEISSFLEGDGERRWFRERGRGREMTDRE